MDSLKNADTKILQLKEQLAHLSKEQHSRGRILSILIKERNKLLHDIPQEAVPYPEDGSLPQYDLKIY
uniref:Uncharacterized protein n=1 Tax=Arion vulgaris TaxID=1028688 RepID=A0A0B7ADS0_9EUPU